MIGIDDARRQATSMWIRGCEDVTPLTGLRADEADSDPADAMVIFGITGDLARVMTFHSLYRLEQKGDLSCSIVGVAIDDWTVDELRVRARSSIEGAGEHIDEEVFERFAKRLSYVHGDLAEPETYQRVADAASGAKSLVHYLEIPPSLFATVVGRLAEAGLTQSARIVVEKPFGHDLASARELADELHRYVDESQLYRVDHFLGKMGLEELLYVRFSNTMIEPVWNRNHVACVQITMAENFGVEDRAGFYDPVGALRDVVVNHLMQVVAAAAMEAPSNLSGDAIKDAQVSLFRSVRDADPAHYVRGQYDGYLDTPGVADGSATETYAALRLDIDNWRWSGVPFFIRTGKHLSAKQTEVRLVFKEPPSLGYRFSADDPRPAPNQLVVRLDPLTGVKMIIDARRAEARRPEAIHLSMDFAQQGGEGPTPYEVVLSAALDGRRARFTRQDGVDETWRIMQPLLDQPPPVQSYAKGSWGPAAADDLVAGFGGWHGPWVES